MTRDAITQQQATNIATSIGVPIANGVIGVVPAMAGGAGSAAVFPLAQNLQNSSAMPPELPPPPTIGLPSLPPPPELPCLIFCLPKLF